MPSAAMPTIVRVGSGLRWAGARYPLDGHLVSPAARTAFAVGAGFALVVLAGVSTNVIGYRSGELNPMWGMLLTLWICGIAFQRVGLRRIGENVKALACFFVLSILATLASAVLATHDAPYVDRYLIAIDRALVPGFDWKKTVLAIDENQDAGFILGRAYASLNWQPALVLTWLCLAGAADRAERMLSAFGVALVGCIALSPMLPALGGYCHFGIARQAVPSVQLDSAWAFRRILDGLRDGSVHELSSATLSGMVTMPSFHAAAAVILAWAAWTSRWLRWPLVALDATMLISTVPIGGHYLIDVLAGIADATIAIWLTSNAGTGLRRLSSADARRPFSLADERNVRTPSIT